MSFKSRCLCVSVAKNAECGVRGAEFGVNHEWTRINTNFCHRGTEAQRGGIGYLRFAIYDLRGLREFGAESSIVNPISQILNCLLTLLLFPHRRVR